MLDSHETILGKPTDVGGEAEAREKLPTNSLDCSIALLRGRGLPYFAIAFRNNGFHIVEADEDKELNTSVHAYSPRDADAEIIYRNLRRLLIAEVQS